jgi:hypothetical protein
MLALAAALVLAAAPKPAPAPAPGAESGGEPERVPQLVVSYEFDLSDATGVVPVTWPTLALDRGREETYVVADGVVRIFNAVGMEIHRFGDDGAVGHINRVAVLDEGDIVALSTINGATAYLRFDYRGELITRFALSGLPKGLAAFEPDQLLHRKGRLYFAERGSMRVVVTDLDGTYRQSYALAELVSAAAAPPAGAAREGPRFRTQMDGFGVDDAGNLLFTMSTMFQAGIVSPTGTLRLFGQRGSTPGRFNNVGGIDADEQGNIFITDRLRCVVSVWSPSLRHIGDFGYRGWGPSNLITPYDIAVGGGRVLVAQAAKRGVKAFRVKFVRPDAVEIESQKAPAPAPTRPPAPASARVPASVGGVR